MPSHATEGRGRRIVHAEVSVRPAPSGLPTRHLVSADTGATSLFVAEQWLRPGQRVPLHLHPVEEALIFLAGTGEATIGHEPHPIAAGVTLHVPARVVHGFSSSGDEDLHLLVVFPGPRFAETTFVED